LISSGMVQSRDRKPASTWAMARPIFDATRATAMVLFTSPATTTTSGFSRASTGSISTITLAVCCAWEPLPTPRCASGSGIPRSWKKTSDIFPS